MANRFDSIPRHIWERGTSQHLKLLSRDLEAVERALREGGGVLAELPAGTTVAVRPNEQGTWAGVLPERIPGVVYWWQRSITPATNAPVPTFGDGYVDGDMVDPLAEDEFLPFTGPVFSESGIVTANTDLKGREADNYAGGAITAFWGTANADPAGEAQARARIIPGATYMELYDLAVAHISTPPLPLAGSYRVAFDVRVDSHDWAGGIVLRGNGVTDRTVSVWWAGNTTNPNQATWSIRHGSPDQWASDTTLGTVTPAQWSRATITVAGTQVTVTHGGSTWEHNLTGEDATMPRQFAITTGPWRQASIRNLTVENL